MLGSTPALVTPALVTPTLVKRAVVGLLRRADAALAEGAAHNAAVSIATRQARHLEDARTLHDLQRLERLMAADRLTRAAGRR